MQVFSFLLLLLQSNFCALDLLALKSHWFGHGVGFLYPRRLTLLSDKLVSQVSLMTSYVPIPLGKSWVIKMKISLNCQALDYLNSGETNTGVGFFLTLNNPRGGIMNYDYRNYQEIFGMIPRFTGLATIFYRNNLYVKLNKDKKLNREELKKRAHICKAYLEREGQISIRAVYDLESIVLYIAGVGEKQETLCASFEVKNLKLENVFITFTAMDEKSKCGSQVFDLHVEGDFENRLRFVDSKDKTIEDEKFAYFERFPSLSHFDKVLNLQKQNSKILAQEILAFADFNQIEVLQEINNRLGEVENAIENALQTTELEAGQLENLNLLLGNERRKLKKDTEDLADIILEQLLEVEMIYKKVDRQTQLIESTIWNLNNSTNFGSLFNGIQKLSSKLQKLVETSAIFETLGNVTDIHVVRKGRHQIRKFKRDFVQGLSKSSMESFNQSKYTILGLLSGILLIGFLIIVMKIKKTSEIKRII